MNYQLGAKIHFLPFCPYGYANLRFAGMFLQEGGGVAPGVVEDVVADALHAQV